MADLKWSEEFQDLSFKKPYFLLKEKTLFSFESKQTKAGIHKTFKDNLKIIVIILNECAVTTKSSLFPPGACTINLFIAIIYGFS